MGQITRQTFFKLPKTEDQDAALEAYKKLSAEAKKDGKPYILSYEVHKLYDDPRSNGYTIVAKTTFSSLDDMKYYDDDCEAHATLKKNLGPRAGGPSNIFTTYFDS